MRSLALGTAGCCENLEKLGHYWCYYTYRSVDRLDRYMNEAIIYCSCEAASQIEDKELR
jgi:hypothetical protein